LESPTQTPADAAAIESSGILQGKGARQAGGGVGIPAAKSYAGALPDEARGIEFTTPIKPTPGMAPPKINWYQGTPGVQDVDGDTVSIPFNVTKNTQK
jgi:hypothetical protein